LSKTKKASANSITAMKNYRDLSIRIKKAVISQGWVNKTLLIVHLMSGFLVLQNILNNYFY